MMLLFLDLTKIRYNNNKCVKYLFSFWHLKEIRLEDNGQVFNGHLVA